jgi:hypothetical protein
MPSGGGYIIKAEGTDQASGGLEPCDQLEICDFLRGCAGPDHQQALDLMMP